MPSVQCIKKVCTIKAITIWAHFLTNLFVNHCTSGMHQENSINTIHFNILFILLKIKNHIF